MSDYSIINLFPSDQVLNFYWWADGRSLTYFDPKAQGLLDVKLMDLVSVVKIGLNALIPV